MKYLSEWEVSRRFFSIKVVDSTARFIVYSFMPITVFLTTHTSERTTVLVSEINLYFPLELTVFILVAVYVLIPMLKPFN